MTYFVNSSGTQATECSIDAIVSFTTKIRSIDRYMVSAKTTGALANLPVMMLQTSVGPLPNDCNWRMRIKGTEDTAFGDLEVFMSPDTVGGSPGNYPMLVVFAEVTKDDPAKEPKLFGFGYADTQFGWDKLMDDVVQFFAHQTIPVADGINTVGTDVVDEGE